MKMTGLLVSLRRRHCITLAVQDKKPIFLTILNVSLNPLQKDVTLLANNSQHCPLSNIVGSCCVRLRVALGLSVKKYLCTKRRCHNELESVLLWLPFVILTEETGDEYWRTVKMKTTVFSLWVQFLGIADGATAIINRLVPSSIPSCFHIGAPTPTFPPRPL